MQITQVTASGEMHGLINTIANSVPAEDSKHLHPKIKEKVEKERKEDSKLVKVEYINSRSRIERLDKQYCRYAGDPIQQWHLIPGYTYEIPYGMVKEINAVRVPKRSGLVSLDGNNLNANGSPLDKDLMDEQLHRLVPAGFSGIAA